MKEQSAGFKGTLVGFTSARGVSCGRTGRAFQGQRDVERLLNGLFVN